MAYSLGERFPPPPTFYKLLDPGSYQWANKKVNSNKVPFLSRTPRSTQPGNKIWTHAVYNAHVQSKIPNITCMASKSPRFPHKAFDIEDIETLICRCDDQSTCDCPTEIETNKQEDIICQGKVRKRIYKGSPPKFIMGENTPSQFDKDYVIKKNVVDSPPFYDTTVHESTQFYQGCKWSKWTSKRSPTIVVGNPGPAHYQVEKSFNDSEICAEKFRSFRRRTSKQLRFVEQIQQRNIIENLPGPASYNPMLPHGHKIQRLGPKADRFITTSAEQRPGPADHFIKRAFDIPAFPEASCTFKLQDPPPFGATAQRLKTQREEGPSPASYNPKLYRCHFTHCSTAPFGVSSVRFKENRLDEEENENGASTNDEPMDKHEKPMQRDPCSSTWEFRSKTVRMKLLEKKYNEPSPADLPPSKLKADRLQNLQHIAPFFTSEGRFEPWYNWINVFGREQTPGPGYYCLEKPKCYPAVKNGPLSQAPRFLTINLDNPPPNQYTITGGIETILTTHNQRLKNNINNQRTFKWQPRIKPKELSYEEKETILINKSIALLDTERKSSTLDSLKSDPQPPPPPKEKSKLLRCFLQSKQMPNYF